LAKKLKSFFKLTDFVPSEAAVYWDSSG